MIDARTSIPPSRQAFLPRDGLGRLFTALQADGREVIGPTVRDGAIVYEPLDDATALPYGVAARSEPGRYRLETGDPERAFDYGVGLTPWKRVTFPPVVPLTTTVDDEPGLVQAVVPHRRAVALIGVRACELAAIATQDRVLRAGPAGDVDHAARQSGTLVVAVECAAALSTCFCTSMGTGPEVEDGADIVLSEVDGGFTVRARTPDGERVVDGLSLPAAGDEPVAQATAQVAAVRAAIGDPLPTDGLADRLRANPDHPRWAEVAERCLACTNCTLVCPTCFCTSVTVASDLDGVAASTERTWDSCFTLGFGRIAGDANFRPKVADRYRQWLTHKFSTWWDQFGSSGCVGCGRCITWCPVGIDVREELLAIAGPTEPVGPIPWPIAPADGHAPAPLATVAPARYATVHVSAVRRETADTITLRLATADTGLLASRPGQFVMVAQAAQTVPPISISRIRPDGLELTVRNVGPATAALTSLGPGARLSVRGPFGRPWPVESAQGGDVVIVGGGIGLAPLRPVIDAIMRERHRYRALYVYLGARTPRDRLFVDEVQAIAGRTDLEVAEIVDRAGPEWFGRVGVVTQLLDQATWTGERTTAFICGPDRMMQATARAIAARGVAVDRTWVTLERNMACGVGLCGHCQLGPYFVCRDGPVFSLAELGDTFTVEGR
ncbi:MAG TPA: 4Fe-4S dicluster domain-containing protein [Candidatus Limnocylindrales bacterium]|jgi:NAD(P)H-flavin reductase|nr:4Fe-4S dicluster domain-containing protein [Candidatus Limnocylindrales bacterium]